MLKISSSPKRNLILMSLFSAIAGLLFGFDTGIISGALPFIQNDFQISTKTSEIVVSSVLISAALSTIVSGYLSDHIGRRTTLVISALCYLFGATLSACSENIKQLILARLIIGTAIGISSYLAPLYIAEISSKSSRGALVACNTIMVTFGIVVAYMSSYILAPYPHNWRYMFAVGSIPALMLLLGLHSLPQSPRFIAKKYSPEKAREVLKKIRPRDVIEEEIKELNETVTNNNNMPLKTLFMDLRYSPLMLIGVVLAILQQTSGINAILYYCPTLLHRIGEDSIHAQLLGSIGIGLINFIGTIIAMLSVDRFGRRMLLLYGFGFMCCSLLLFSALLPHSEQKIISIALLLLLTVFIISYAISIGCVFWIVISEIYPLTIRSTAMSIAACANWLANFLIASTFLSLTKSIGFENCFIFYATMCGIGFVFIYRIVPETKQLSLEHIESKIQLNGFYLKNHHQ